MRKYLRRKEAAAYLGLAAQTLARWAVEGFGPPVLKLGRAVAYDVDDLDRFATSRRGWRATTTETHAPSAGRAA